MGNLNVIDQFLQTFIRYIDSGFGLLSGDVGFLTTTLIGIDMTLAALFWALEGEANVLARLISKILYVGAFAFIINNFSLLATIIYNSFSGLGLEATGSAMNASDLLHPGKLAGTGFQAAWPLMQQIGKYSGFTGIIDNFPTILVLLAAWLIVVLAFFVLAIQLFITILEFKLTTLAGFVLVPFALWGKTAFLAERVLGSVISTGIKVMVLAIIIGIGSTFFNQFISALNNQEPSLSDAMSLVLASLSLFGLGIFGPGIAAGLVSGAPQLGAGAAVGTAAAMAGTAMLAGGALRAAGGGALNALRAGTALGSGASTSYNLARATSGSHGAAGVAAGLGGVARAAAGAARAGLAGGFQQGADQGRQAVWRATGGSSPAASSMPGAAEPPGWARRMRSEQRLRAHGQAATQALREGDRSGGGLSPDLSEKEH